MTCNNNNYKRIGMQNQLMVAIFVAVGVTLVAGLVVIPEIEQQAALADNGNHFGQIKNGNNGKHKGQGGIDT